MTSAPGPARGPGTLGRVHAARGARGLAAALALVVAGCAGPPAARTPGPPSPTPAATPRLPFGILPLGGMAPGALRLARPYRAAGRLPGAPPVIRISRVPFNPSIAVADFARGLGLAGPPMAVGGGGLAYNLLGTAGFQLTTTAGLTFALHPDHPVEEIGATPTLAQANRVAQGFFRTRHLVPGGSLALLPSITRVNGSDRRITYALTLGGLPVVDITGAAALIEVDVATDGSGRMAVVGAGGRLPFPATGAPASYRSWAPDQVIAALNRGAVTPDGYRLAADGRPYPEPSLGPEPANPARLLGDRLAVVVAAGYAVPVYVFRVGGRPGVRQFVTCALPPTECLPLRYRAPRSAATH